MIGGEHVKTDGRHYSEKYYFCPGCRGFHCYDNDKAVSKKLCFICGEKKDTKIYGNSMIGHVQACEECGSNLVDDNGKRLRGRAK